ncbi:DEAD/DEAH box helicase [Novosphingobium aureum]|uniref:DEAD/DEAH box helicase n=1 Tax=Novosphingobium aureum TaxID=2792964 RepID=UPI002B49109D|nr:DEAD/DEAH box helicase [Novosphingobium aureum]
MSEQIAFVASDQPDGREKIELRQTRAGGLFRRASTTTVPMSEWVRTAPRGGMAALSRLRAMNGGADVVESSDAVIISAAASAALSEVEALALGLPPATDLTLQLRSTGSLHEGTIAVEHRWVRRGGVSVRAREQGARVRETGKVARLPEPMYSTLANLHELRDAEPGDARQAAFARLREQLGDLGEEKIEADGTIERLRIAYASNFSLDLRTQGGLFDFDPVLFSRRVVENEDGDLLDAEDKALLTDYEHQRFRQRFRTQKGGRRSYLLPDGTLLYLDSNLGKALDVVREKQAAPAEERRIFARAPQRYIREELALDETGDDDAADHLFLETQQYSERVAGIEEWQPPVLPWIKPTPNSWLPESFGLTIGEPPNQQHVPFEAGDAEKLETSIGTALDKGDASVPFGDFEIPANTNTLNAVREIAELENQFAHADQAGSEDAEPPVVIPTYFLKVGENFEELYYSRQAAREVAARPFNAPDMPTVLRSSPKPHQKEGFAWLTEAFTRKVPGIVLADDMGLGKTFQALAFLAWLRNVAAPDRPVLIVAPTGLLRNWLNEIELHLERDALGKVIEAFGTGLKQWRDGTGNDIRGGTSKLDVSQWRHAGVVLTTFETMRDYHMSLARVPFSAIVYDEIQKLKNPASQMTRAAKALNAHIQIGMTGTPVENRLQDLWSIADVVYPGFLGTSREFEEVYPPHSSEALHALQDRIIERDGVLPPFMLRRMKEGLLSGLPTKTIVPYEVPMPPPQEAAYNRILARARAMRESGDRGAMLKILHMLRGTSLHPEEPVGLGDFESYIRASARLSKTFELLSQIEAKREKALIFCEDLDMQAFLSSAIEEQFNLERSVPVINGSVAGAQRQTIVADFQSRAAGFDVMILSPKAGGVGLTITKANHVIHLSRWWNPAVEDQATDRVYRIGQDKPVTVHIPMAVHPDETIGPSSFDVRLNSLMQSKRELSRGLLVPPEADNDLDTMLSGVLDGDRETSPQSNETASPPSKQTIETGDAPSGSASDTASSAEQGDDAEGRRGKPVEEPRRPILSVRPTPVDIAQTRTPDIGRVEFEVGGLRDWTIFTQHIEDMAIQVLQIIDPYCCAQEDARRRLADFIARFDTAAASIGKVHVVSFDADSLRDSYESNEEQCGDIVRKVASKLPNINFHHAPRSRRATGDLHDRRVTATFADGSRVIWDLGRGIDGIMSPRFGCVVNATVEQS